MALTPQKQLNYFLDRFTAEQISEDYLRLYEDSSNFCCAFAWLHEHYNNAFEFMNYKAPNGAEGHFNADPSRELLQVNDEYLDLMKLADKAGKHIKVSPEYQRVIESSRQWLTSSGGSPIPEKLTPITIERYNTVFEVEDSGIMLTGVGQTSLQLVGEGAYAVVHKFLDPNYGFYVARKKLKKSTAPKELQRFRKEYTLMSGFDFPYILKVFHYDESNNSYTMEYCEYTLKDYISHNNQKLTYRVRHKMAMQFLYAMNFLHNHEVCHRDLSYKNVLIHAYRDGGAFTVKVSDFGLAKETNSDLTSTGSVMKGSITDPALGSFKNFAPVNDIYAIGFILSYIFTGREQLFIDDSQLSSLIQKCSANDPGKRYQNVRDIIEEMKKMEDPEIARKPFSDSSKTQ